MRSQIKALTFRSLFDIMNTILMEVENMSLSYKRLWKLLIDKGLNKNELHKITGLSQSTIAKLTKGENVNTDVLLKICQSLECDISDIVEIEKRNEK